ncbi:MAG: antibiotic biosynthesis monooxygenase [Phycisphaerales bacterium]|nr:antibiotic biosynthesis monooxygenase [Phycisphaerales bacterium]
MVILDLRIRIAAGQRPALLEFLRDAIPFYEAPGGIRVTLFEDSEDPTRLIERVEYTTRADYERDQQRVATDPEMRGWLERWRTLLAEPPVVETYRALPVLPGAPA